MRSLFAVAVLMGAASPAPGQAVGDRRFDPVSGDYFVQVMNDSLQLLELRIVPPNKVLVSLGVKVGRGELHPYRYVYRVSIRKGTRQPLAFLEIDCPLSTVIDKLTAIAVRNGISRRWSAEQITSPDRPRCDIDHPNAPLDAGGTLEVGLETTLLPTIGELRGFGRTGGFNWPTSDPIEENEPAQEVVRAVSGLNGGWKSVPAPVPGRDPANVTGVGTGISILHSDLDRACGDLAWISSAGVCSSLRNRLQQATPPVTRGNNVRARARLESFLAELAAQHDPAATLPVNDAAFWLLKTNAEFVLRLIPGAGR
jgi:hypothetical protein